MKPLVRFLLFAAILAVLLTILASCAEAFSKNRGNPAPGFELSDLDGTVHKLSDYEDHKVYLYFWSSWCSICLAGMNDLNELQKSEDFTVLTIVSPGVQAEKQTPAFIHWYSTFGHNAEMIVLLDEGGKVHQRYEIKGFPSSVFIGSDGRMAEKHTGHLQNTEIFESMNSIR